MNGKISLLAFAGARDAIGLGETIVDVNVPLSARALFDSLVVRWPALAAHATSLRLAVNERYADWDELVRDGDVVALIPPVAGG